MPYFIRCLLSFGSPFGSTCSISLEIGKHTESSLSIENAMVNGFAHALQRQGSGWLSTLVEHISLSLLVLGPAKSSSAHMLVVKPQLAQWSCLSVPECKSLFSVCNEK